MSFILNIFNFSKRRKTTSKSWCGLWSDKNGKQIIIQLTKHNFYTVSILDKNNKYFEINTLRNSKRKTKKLTGFFTRDINENPILQVEAGCDNIGPTYELYFLTQKKNGEYRLSKSTDNIKDIVIRPNVGLGLYDDWEDDLGIPWAFPLDDFRNL